MPDRTIFRSWDYNSYKADPPVSGIIGSTNPSSGLVWDKRTMTVASELDGVEKTTVYDVRGNVITGDGTSTLHTYDASA